MAPMRRFESMRVVNRWLDASTTGRAEDEPDGLLYWIRVATASIPVGSGCGQR